MAVQVPTPRQLGVVAEEMGLSLTEVDVQSFINLMRPSIAAYNLLDAMPDNLPPVKYSRTPGARPAPEENRHNAWYYKTTVNGAPQGKLKGKTIVLKDNIMLAGVPMMNGAATLEGYMPFDPGFPITKRPDQRHASFKASLREAPQDEGFLQCHQRLPSC